jgi:tetratricopeptide (TPR) repeat protein
MWSRRKQEPPAQALDLDEEIRRLRGVVAQPGGQEAVGPLIALLTARATLAGINDLDERRREDRRAAAGLLRAFDGLPSPVDRHTDLLARLGLLPVERGSGRLDEALDAAAWAVEHLGDIGPDERELCAAYLVDLDLLRADLAAAGRRDEALRVATLASDLATRLAEQDEPAYAEALAVAWVNEAAARANAGDFDGAHALNTEAIALLEERSPGSRALTTALANRAHLERRDGRWSDAVATEQRLAAEAHDADPESAAEVARLNGLFLTLVRAGRKVEAEATAMEAVEVARRLAAADPARESTVATLLGNLANVRRELGRLDDAFTASSEALRIREHDALTRPSPESDQGLAMVLNNHSGLLRRLGRIAEAADCAGRSVEVRRRLAAADGSPNRVALLANSLNTHAEQVWRLGEPERAVALAEEATALFESLPPPGAVKKFLRANQQTYGQALAAAGRVEDAIAASGRAVALGREAAAEVPGETSELAGCLESYADVLDRAGRAEEGAAARAEATHLREGSS